MAKYFSLVLALSLFAATHFARAVAIKSPYSPHGVVDSFAETKTHFYLLQLDLEILTKQGGSGPCFRLFRVSKTDLKDVKSFAAEREHYLDGGSRIIDFVDETGAAKLYLPVRPGETDFEGLGQYPAFIREGAPEQKTLLWSASATGTIGPNNIFDEAQQSKISQLYDGPTRIEFFRTKQLPQIDETAALALLERKSTWRGRLVTMAHSVANSCANSLRGALGR